MKNQKFQQGLVKYIETNYNSDITIDNVSYPPQGMSSSVFFIRLFKIDCAVKYGQDVTKDVTAINLIKEKQLRIPVPNLIAAFTYKEVPVIILQKIDHPLYESVPNMPKYIPSIVKTLNELHAVKSAIPGPLSEVGKKTWEETIMSIFNGDTIDWKEVSEREGVDKELIISSIEKMKNKIENTVFKLKEFSLLHTDFNQRNLFVDTKKYEISGVIDWEDAMYGDPIYDFARVRMYMWHFNFSVTEIEKYYKLVNFTPEQRNLEDLYWLSRVIQYMAWYSEELNDFNVERINLHQDYLRKYNW